jgi:ureidoacrylate peracid hydrolase
MLPSIRSPVIERDRPLERLSDLGLLVVDVQYQVAALGHGDLAGYDRTTLPPDKRFFLDRLETTVLPNIRALQDAMRKARREVLFTTVENLTQDGRDRGLDYKISGFDVAPHSREAQVLDEIAPVGDEMRFRKTSSSVFNSTTIEYVLRNLDIGRLIITGVLTDQCVISAVRDACDRGFLVIVPEDACATYSSDRHHWALELTKGYCRLTDTATLCGEIDRLRGAVSC